MAGSCKTCGACHLGVLRLVGQFGILNRLSEGVGEGVRSVRLDGEERAEAGPLCCSDYLTVWLVSLRWM
jgi:hypothetical protein